MLLPVIAVLLKLVEARDTWVQCNTTVRCHYKLQIVPKKCILRDCTTPEEIW